MVEPISHPGLAAVAYLVPGLVWGLLAYVSARFVRDWRPESSFLRLLPVVGALGAANYAVMMVISLVPMALHLHPPLPLRALYLLGNMGQVSLGATALHLVRYAPGREAPPSRAWLVANYGAIVVIGLVSLFPALGGAHDLDQRLRLFFAVRNAYIAVVLALIGRHAVRMVRRGTWRPGGLGEVRTTDVVLILAGVAGAAGWVVVSMWRSPLSPASPALLVYDMLIGLGLAAPLAVRALGQLAPPFLLAITMLGAAAGIHLGGRALADASDPAFLPLIDVGTVIALVLVLVGGQTGIRAVIHRLLFRTSDRRRDAIEAFFHALPPELGVDECARRALATLIDVMQLRGVALVSDGDHPPIVVGTLDARQITHLWPRAGVPVFRGGLLEYDFTLLPEALKDALAAAEVASMLPVASPRRTWGHLLLRTGLLGATAGAAQLDPVRAFADQLALALDAADVVARALAVERSLAHAEKLAAIGELAARIAHEIRNPVTAARSLAQQLAREPGAPFVVEHEVILAELERVERQVAALLRFARRDEFRFEAVDLAELVRSTVEAFRARLSSAGIDVDVAAGFTVTARADREKLRQVLVNLIENAIDALANGNAAKRLQVSVYGDDGHATIQVSDNGPGVPPDALPHLFEPFFSLKETGTGLGLAIARRTVDAHGGRIAAMSTGVGVTFVVELPLAGRS